MAKKIDNKLEAFNTNDLALGEMFFKIYDNKNKAISFLNRMLGTGNIEPLRFVSRYLLSKGINPVMAKELLDKYIVVVIYACIKYNESDGVKLIEGELVSQQLESICNVGLTIDQLNAIPNDDNLFNQIINAKDESVKNRRNEIFAKIIDGKELKKSLKEALNNFKSLIDYRKKYFDYNTQFVYFSKERRTSDLLIAEARNYNLNRNFNFEIPVDNNNFVLFESNIRDYGTNTKLTTGMIRDAKVVLAFLINDYITLNKNGFDEVYTITSNELKCYELAQQASLSSHNRAILSFLAWDERTGKYYPRLSSIKAFRVLYNNELYSVSSEGINRL